MPWVEWWQNRRLKIRIARPPRAAREPEPARFTTETSRPVTGTDFMASEVDPILDKISAHGIHSLTTEERNILDRAQKRMARR